MRFLTYPLEMLFRLPGVVAETTGHAIATACGVALTAASAAASKMDEETVNTVAQKLNEHVVPLVGGATVTNVLGFIKGQNKLNAKEIIEAGSKAPALIEATREAAIENLRTIKQVGTVAVLAFGAFTAYQAVRTILSSFEIFPAWSKPGKKKK